MPQLTAQSKRNSSASCRSAACRSLIQVSADMASEKTREREIAALDASMAQFDLGESAIVTMDEQTDIPCEHGVVHVMPAWKWLLA